MERWLRQAVKALVLRVIWLTEPCQCLFSPGQSGDLLNYSNEKMEVKFFLIFYDNYYTSLTFLRINR